MLKKRYIPTPLVNRELHRHRGEKLTAKQQKPVRFRLLYIFWLVLRILWAMAMRRLRPTSSKYTLLGLSQMVRDSMERLGGLWIKAAQIMAMRRDLFPKVFCDELALLHDRARSFPGEIAKSIIEQELGVPIEDIFRDFDIVPIAAASIGQVHTAVLRENGVKVAIKVQRPRIAESFGSDFKIVSGLVTMLRLFRVLLWTRWDEMLFHLQRTLSDELDYRLEVSSMRKMRKTLKSDKIYVPKAFTRWCKKKVLVMEFIDGVLMSDYIHAHVDAPLKASAWLKENNIRLKKIGKRMYLSFTMQLMDDNLCHGDLHPGNIMLLRDNRVAFIDFGSVSVLESGFLEKYRLSIKALARREFGKYVDVLLTLVGGLPQLDMDKFKSEVVRELESWESLTDVEGIPYEQRSLAGMNVRLMGIFGRYHFPPLWNVLRITRSNFAFDASMQFLLPEIKYFKLMHKHFERSRQRTLKYAASKSSRDDLVSSINDIMRLPATVGENLLFQAEIIRKRAMSFQAQISKAATIGKAVLSTLLNIGLIVTVFVIARFLSKESDAGEKAVAKLPIRDVFAAMPHLTPGMWILVILLSLYLLRNLRKLIKVLGFAGVSRNPFL